MRLFIIATSTILIAVGVFAVLALIVVLPSVRLTPRVFSPESLGDYSFPVGGVIVLASLIAIGIGNVYVRKRALRYWPDGLSTTCVTIGSCEVIAGIVWGSKALTALHRYLNWASHPGSPVLISLQFAIIAIVIGKGIWTIMAEVQAAKQQSAFPK